MGLPAAFVAAVPDALVVLMLRYARTHGPFLAPPIAVRWGLPLGAVDAALSLLEARGELMRGNLRPGGTEREWCHPSVLRRIKRQSLAALRAEVASVEPEVFARFLPVWHGIGSKRGGRGRLEEALDQLEGLPLPWSALEAEIFAARVPGFQPRMLDELGAMGTVVWIGRGALGPRDGRVALYRRERVSALFEPLEAPEDLLAGDDPATVVRGKLLAYLERRGACFLVELQRAAEAPLEEVSSALWDLVWAGLVTNDTFLPLRSLQRKKGRRSARDRSRTAGGRWSLVRDLLFDPPSATERAHACARVLLQRYGIVSRDAARHEGLSGGFGAVYGVLRAMEESGRVRRGHFVEHLAGAQFALPGSVDRLRAQRTESSGTLVLAAADPAAPWGALLPWPERPGPGQPRRVTGAKVVSVEGVPVLYIPRTGRSVLTFSTFEEVLLAGIRGWLEGCRGTVRLEKIDGAPVGDCPLLRVFLEAGFAEGYQSLEYAGRL
jgi:ATP-dependent Lhr-like helicase